MGNYDADRYKNLVRRYLEPLSPLIEAQLRAIFSYRFPRTSRLHFLVFPNGLSGQLPVTVFCTDESGSQSPHRSGAFPMRLAELVEHVIPPAEAHLAAEYDRAGVETVEIELQALVEWFADCWAKAGGLDFPLPATIGVRGDIEVFDLKHRAWVHDTHAIRQKNLWLANKEKNE